MYSYSRLNLNNIYFLQDIELHTFSKILNSKLIIYSNILVQIIIRVRYKNKKIETWHVYFGHGL